MKKIMVLLNSLLVLGGCMKEYNVDYQGMQEFYKGAKSSYPAGKTVKFSYDVIATDTNYSFDADAEDLHVEYSDKEGFIITFIMPEHDVTVTMTSKNTMVHERIEYSVTSEETEVNGVKMKCTGVNTNPARLLIHFENTGTEVFHTEGGYLLEHLDSGNWNKVCSFEKDEMTQFVLEAGEETDIWYDLEEYRELYASKYRITIEGNTFEFELNQ